MNKARLNADGEHPSSEPVEAPQRAASPVGAISAGIYKQILDCMPLAAAVACARGADQCIVYMNPAFAALMSRTRADIEEGGGNCLDSFLSESGAGQSLADVVRISFESVIESPGTFRATVRGERPLVVRADIRAVEHGEGEAIRLVTLTEVGAPDAVQIERLENKLRERDMLMRELQHRVKNNLQLVTALVRMEARAAGEGEGVALSRIAGRIEALTSLYRALSADDAAGEIDLGIYLDHIATAAMQANARSGITLRQETSKCPVLLNVAMLTGLLVNEMFTNALKYAFEDCRDGSITLFCRRNADHVTVAVHDDGVGLGEDDWPPPRKLGGLILQALKENARKVAFTSESPAGQGTRFTLTFDIAEPDATN